MTVAGARGRAHIRARCQRPEPTPAAVAPPGRFPLTAAPARSAPGHALCRHSLPLPRPVTGASGRARSPAPPSSLRPPAPPRCSAPPCAAGTLQTLPGAARPRLARPPAARPRLRPRSAMGAAPRSARRGDLRAARTGEAAPGCGAGGLRRRAQPGPAAGVAAAERGGAPANTPTPPNPGGIAPACPGAAVGAEREGCGDGGSAERPLRSGGARPGRGSAAPVTLRNDLPRRRERRGPPGRAGRAVAAGMGRPRAHGAARG